jgi:hypothetical protein
LATRTTLLQLRKSLAATLASRAGQEPTPQVVLWMVTVLRLENLHQPAPLVRSSPSMSKANEQPRGTSNASKILPPSLIAAQ